MVMPLLMAATSPNWASLKAFFSFKKKKKLQEDKRGVHSQCSSSVLLSCFWLKMNYTKKITKLKEVIKGTYFGDVEAIERAVTMK